MAEIHVTLDQGILRGTKDVSYSGSNFYKFLGIPYAKPPVGELRFRAPQPLEPWQGTLDCTEERDQCFSRHAYFHKLMGSEDCLFLNVFTPQLLTTSSTPSKPVLVFIHGGGFTMGSSSPDVYGPQFLLSEDVVLVTFNYRLGLLGFLSLEDSSLGVPGNAALKDQVMALEWVQRNISKFSGDLNNVTIFGESAGAASVHYLMLSPMAKGLFHKVIAQSGCALNCWAFGTRCAKQLAEVLGLDCSDECTILKHLRAIPVEQLLLAQEKFVDNYNLSLIRPFGPVIEKPSGETPFILQHPLEVMSSGDYNKVPFLFGYNDREGMFVEIARKASGKSFLITDFENAIPWSWNIKRGSEKSKIIARKIKEFYYGNEEPSMQNIDQYYKLQTDNFFLRELYQTARIHIQTSKLPHYFYRFSLDAELNLYKSIGDQQTPGACHADELGYLFKNLTTPELPTGSVEDVGVRRMVKLWTNFAQHGAPIPRKDALLDVDWRPINKNELFFVDIGEKLTEGVNPDIDRVVFWEKLLKERYDSKL